MDSDLLNTNMSDTPAQEMSEEDIKQFRAERNRHYYLNNIEYIRARNLARSQSEEGKESAKRYYQNNKEALRLKAKERYLANREAILKQTKERRAKAKVAKEIK